VGGPAVSDRMSIEHTAVTRLRIVMAQLNLLVGDITGNVEKMVRAAQRARDELRADAVVFPELAICGYPPEDLLLRPGFLVRVKRGLAELCPQVRGIDVIVGHPHHSAGRTYNAASLLREGEVIATYHKQHLPNYAVFDEKRYFDAGTQPCVVPIKGVPVGITVCEDLWEPGPAAQAARAGARLLLNVNASPFHVGKGGEREAILRRRVEEAGVPVVYANVVGGQDELVFDGESLVMDAEGRVTQRAPAFVEGLYPVDLLAGAERIVVQPGEVAAPLHQEQSMYRALVLGVRDYVRKNGFSGAVIGLSGGIDSALTLCIAVDALGAERVEAVLMPSRYTAAMSIEDAEAQARALGVAHSVISIEPPFQAFLEALAGDFAGAAPDTAEENIQARCRGVILMAISNKKHRIVLTTGNKSEMAVGYATLYGDMAGGFAPIKDVPKTWVYRLCRYRNAITPVIPTRVLERPPSAELAPDQKDEDTLPPYAELDPILEMYVERDLCVEDIVAAGYDETTVRRVAIMVDRNEYKRRQAPPGVRISRRAFGRDRRYPITSGYGKGLAGPAAQESGT
jgi:NAD+ synthase (glutamine-hydrolysing)